LPVDFLGRMQCWWLFGFGKEYIQGDFEGCAEILITSYWLHVDSEKIFKKFYVKK
jgi:hypothetical protein